MPDSTAIISAVTDTLNSIVHVTQSPNPDWNYLLPIIIPSIFVLVSFIFNIIQYNSQRRKEKAEREDKYKFALIERKLDAMQHAYNYCVKLQLFAKGYSEEKCEFNKSLKKWYNENNLFLFPDIRTAINKAVNIIDAYNNKLEQFHSSKHNNKEKADILNDEIHEEFGFLGSVCDKIQNAIDDYYHIDK
jgi:hypothetical protein